jgi:hypothetical protein
VSTQAVLFTDSPLRIGSRWSVRRDKGANVWEIVGIDGDEYRLRCVSAMAGVDVHVAGDEIEVEAAWFAVRGALAAGVCGAVRRMA